MIADKDLELGGGGSLPDLIFVSDQEHTGMLEGKVLPRGALTQDTHTESSSETTRYTFQKKSRNKTTIIECLREIRNIAFPK